MKSLGRFDGRVRRHCGFVKAMRRRLATPTEPPVFHIGPALTTPADDVFFSKRTRATQHTYHSARAHKHKKIRLYKILFHF